MLMRLAWTACWGGSAGQECFCLSFTTSVCRAPGIDWYKSLPRCAWCQAHEREGPGHGQMQIFLALFYQYIVVMLYGNMRSTHKLWYAVLLKVRTSLIHSLVSRGHTSSNIFALCYFWCNKPYLPPGVAAPSLHHVLSAGSADWGSRPTGISLGTLGCPRQGLCNCPAFVDRPKARSQHSALWVTLYGVQLLCGFRPGFQTASCHLELEQLKTGRDGMWSPPGTGVCILCSNTSMLGFQRISVKEVCGACCLPPLGGAAPCLMSAACASPSWKGEFQKIAEKAEADKGQGTIEWITASGQLEQSWILPEKKASI